jgi:defect-in-organelle-trafficking protein DotB
VIADGTREGLTQETVVADDPWNRADLSWVTDPRKSAPGLDSLLSWAYRSGASRVSFQTGHCPWLRIYGRNRKIGDTTLDEAEIAQIVNHLYGADGMARLQGCAALDTTYEIAVSRTERLRYRLNVTSTRSSRRLGVNVVLRPIPGLPPSLEEQLVEPGIMEAFRPRNGMVIVSGGTGSGKSTLIAGMTIAKLLDPNGHYDIVEGAAPVEFLLDRVKSPSSTINQSEIPRDLPNFEEFIRGCMRREPTDIIVGECRETATMSAAIQAAISGHTLTTTIHANDVALTMQRIASLCPLAERENLISAVAQSLQLVVNQRLTPSLDGKRTALREFLAFDRKLRNRFLETDPAQWPGLTRRATEDQGQSFAQAIDKALQDGRISEETAAHELREEG